MKNPRRKPPFDRDEVANKVQNLVGSLKVWAKKASDYTFEEGKVLTIRAKEAGKLTSLNARKHRLGREYQELCAQLGQQILGLTKAQEEKVLSNPRVQELMGKAKHLEGQLKKFDREIESYKQACDSEVDKIHNKAA